MASKCSGRVIEPEPRVDTASSWEKHLACSILVLVLLPIATLGPLPGRSVLLQAGSLGGNALSERLGARSHPSRAYVRTSAAEGHGAALSLHFLGRRRGSLGAPCARDPDNTDPHRPAGAPAPRSGGRLRRLGHL